MAPAFPAPPGEIRRRGTAVVLAGRAGAMRSQWFVPPVTDRYSLPPAGSVPADPVRGFSEESANARVDPAFRAAEEAAP